MCHVTSQYFFSSRRFIFGKMNEEAVNVASINQGSRKKQRKERNKRQVQNNKYKDNDPLCLEFIVPCKHKPSSLFKCLKLKERDIIRNRERFYTNKGKIKQDVYLCRLITAFKPQRSTAVTRSYKPKPRKFSTNFYVLNINKRAVRVCKPFFMKVFALGRKRLNTICKTIKSGNIPEEKRGGDRKSRKSLEKKKSVCNFIKALPAKESHYNRSKSYRVYLSCELNISKLWKLYNNSVERDLMVKKWFFRHTFVTQFNIGFSSPASDACTTCTLLTNKIKAEQDPHKKQYAITEKRVHKLRANAFYQLLTKEKVDNSYSFCFDLQQVMPLPKTPIQDSFYARQVSFYNFCIVNVDGKDPDFYCWTEDMAGRGSTEIGSALINHLNTLKQNGSLNEIQCIRMFCDGCGGQNKNSFIIDTLMFWLIKESPASLKEIMIVFPVRGHSFLPADRVFGRVEKDLRKITVITTKEKYQEIISQHGTVHFLGKDWKYFDIKSLDKHFKKIEGIRDMKRICIQKKLVRNRIEAVVKTFRNYKFQSVEEEKGKNLLKRNTNMTTVNLEEKELGHFIKGAKKKDVESLLIKQFGADWQNEPSLKWYCDILYGNNITENDDADNENAACDCQEPDCGELHV